MRMDDSSLDAEMIKHGDPQEMTMKVKIVCNYSHSELYLSSNTQSVKVNLMKIWSFSDENLSLTTTMIKRKCLSFKVVPPYLETETVVSPEKLRFNYCSLISDTNLRLQQE